MANKLDLLERNQYLFESAKIGYDVGHADYGADTDWQEAITRTAISHKHDLSFSNAYRNGHIRTSLTYDAQEGIVKKTAFERIAGRVNVDHALFNDKLKLG